MSDHGASDAELAEQLEQEAQELLEAGHGGDSLTLAVDQLRADRTNGESLTASIQLLRDVIDQERNIGPGGAR
jgi:hypothetical protein